MSIKFLNKIVTVSALMSSAGAMEEHATLDQLPVEIKQHIANNLQNQDLSRLACVNSEFYNISQDVYKSRLKQEFGLNVNEAIAEVNDWFSDWTERNDAYMTYHRWGSDWREKLQGLAQNFFKKAHMIELQPISTAIEAYSRVSLIKELIKSLPECFVKNQKIKINSAYIVASSSFYYNAPIDGDFSFPINLWDYSLLLQEGGWSYCVPSKECGKNGVPKYIRYVNNDLMPRDDFDHLPAMHNFGDIKTLDQRDSSCLRVEHRDEDFFLEERNNYLSFLKMAAFKEKYEGLLKATIARNNRKQPPLRQTAVRGNVSRLVDALEKNLHQPVIAPKVPARPLPVAASVQVQPTKRPMNVQPVVAKNMPQAKRPLLVAAGKPQPTKRLVNVQPEITKKAPARPLPKLPVKGQPVVAKRAPQSSRPLPLTVTSGQNRLNANTSTSARTGNNVKSLIARFNNAN